MPPAAAAAALSSTARLETSNVDLGKELTNLIIAQSAYQANTKVVSTSDQVLQSLVQMQ